MKALSGGLAGPGEVQRHPLRIGPQIEVAGNELRALVDTDHPWIAHLGADLFQGRDHVLGPIAEAWIRKSAPSRVQAMCDSCFGFPVGGRSRFVPK